MRRMKSLVHLLLIVAMVYVGSYLSLGTSRYIYCAPTGKLHTTPLAGSQLACHYRLFRTDFEVLLFAPAAEIETTLRRTDVKLFRDWRTERAARQ